MSNEEEEEVVETGPVEFAGNLDSLMDAHMPKDGKALRAGPIFEREIRTFSMDSSTCMPGVFDGPNGEETTFKLSVVALTHQEEIEATRSIKAPTDLPFAMAKKSLYEFNGVKLSDKKRNFLFEAIGPRGRSIVLAAYAEVNAPGDEALGKLQSEWEV